MLMRLLVASAIVLGLAFSVAPGGAESIFQGSDPCTVKYVPASEPQVAGRPRCPMRPCFASPLQVLLHLLEGNHSGMVYHS
jgi:hypothetical protein